MLQVADSTINNLFNLPDGMHNNVEIDDLHQLVRFMRFDEQNSLDNSSAQKNNSVKNKPGIIDLDAIELLAADHQHLSDLFLAYENLANAARDNSAEKAHLIAEICTQLTIHTHVEETIFYPAAKSALLNLGHPVGESIIEYAGLMALIADVEHDQLLGKNCQDKLKVLSEYLKHHIKQDRDSLFAQLRETPIDLQVLGQQIASEKSILNARYHALAGKRLTEKNSKFKGMI